MTLFYISASISPPIPSVKLYGSTILLDIFGEGAMKLMIVVFLYNFDEFSILSRNKLASPEPVPPDIAQFNIIPSTLSQFYSKRSNWRSTSSIIFLPIV